MKKEKKNENTFFMESYYSSHIDYFGIGTKIIKL